MVVATLPPFETAAYSRGGGPDQPSLLSAGGSLKELRRTICTLPGKW